MIGGYPYVYPPKTYFSDTDDVTITVFQECSSQVARKSQAQVVLTQHRNTAKQHKLLHFHYLISPEMI